VLRGKEGGVGLFLLTIRCKTLKTAFMDECIENEGRLATDLFDYCIP